jgi:hypothetical protein
VDVRTRDNPVPMHSLKIFVFMVLMSMRCWLTSPVNVHA